MFEVRSSNSQDVTGKSLILYSNATHEIIVFGHFRCDLI